MKSMRFRFSLLTLMLVIALAGVGTMLYQRHIEWQKAEQEFTLIIESLPRPPIMFRELRSSSLAIPN